MSLSSDLSGVLLLYNACGSQLTRNILAKWPHMEAAFCSYDLHMTKYEQKEMASHEKFMNSGYDFNIIFQIL